MIKEVKIFTSSVKKNYSVIISEKKDFSYIIPFIKNKHTLVVTNDTISKLFLDSLKITLKKYTYKWNYCLLKDGEIYKNNDSLNTIYEYLLKNNYTRDCIIIALGGGIIGDISGFAASTYYRGVDIIQIPTTLLSQVDSSVGGKTGINHILGKNMIGSFYQPKLVYTSIDFLNSLPYREFAAGMAEIIKYGCIIDEKFFIWLEEHSDVLNIHHPDILKYAIAKSCEIKSYIVSLDEKETKNIREILNFGHTFGHAIECCQNYVGLNHGEAVAVGMVIAAKFSEHLGYIDNNTVLRLTKLLQKFKLPINIPLEITKDNFLNSIMRDKKNTLNKVSLVLLKNKLGTSKIEKTFNKDNINSFLIKYNYFND